MKHTGNIDLTIESLAYGGDSVGHDGGRVVFIPGGVPGDRLRARIVQDKGTFLRGTIEEIIEPSPERVEPFCPYASRCGGCQWQDMSYDCQVAWKSRIVGETLQRIGGIDSALVDECRASLPDRPYRTIARYPARRTRNGIVFGYFERRSHLIVDIDRCPVAIDSVNDIAHNIRELLTSDFPDIDIREIVIQSSRFVSSSLVRITASGFRRGEELADALLDRINGLNGVVIASCRRDGTVKGAYLYGSPYREELICGQTFRINERSFFQIHTPQAETLVTVAGKMLAGEVGGHTVDAYGGVGLFGVCLAQTDNTVTLFDTSGDAVADAIFNAETAGLRHFTALETDMAGVISTIGKADTVITDPPRTGMGREAIDAMASLSPRRIIYVSCNPSTLARDIGWLREKGYTTQRVVPVDMFPHTYHIESVALIEHKY